MKSLQRVLAVRFGVTMLIALVVIALWAYVGVQRTLYHLLDRVLQSTAELQKDVLASGTPLAHHPGISDPAQFIKEVNRLITLRDSTGRVVAVNTELARRLPLDSAAFAHAQTGSMTLTTEPWLETKVRVVYLRAPPGSPPGAAVLQVAASLERIQRASRGILLWMLATAFLGAFATFVGAGWLATSVMAPVREIAAQAGAITGSGTNQQITTHADVAEFESLIAVLNEMLARLSRASSWHQRVIRDLGHDLRTPIAAMRAGIEVALWTERTPDEYRRILASALEEVDRLTLISDALVLMGRLVSGQLVARVLPLDAQAVAAESVRRAQQRIGGHRVSLAPGTSAPVHGDARLLGMALDQLIDNGMRHTPADTPVVVSAGAVDGHANLVVEDRGPGVPDDILPHLFEPFYRADAARGRDGGPGLGLTLAAAIVTLHHGTVRAERGIDGGLQIRVSLPSPGAPNGAGQSPPSIPIPPPPPSS